MPLHPNLVRGAFRQIHGYHEEAETEAFDLMDLGEDVTEQLYVQFLFEPFLPWRPVSVHTFPPVIDIVSCSKADVDNIDLPDIHIHKVDNTKPSEPKKDPNALPPQAAALGVDEIMDAEYLSSRFRVVLGILVSVWRVRHGDKFLVFSTFTSLLKLLGDCLDERGVAHIKCGLLLVCERPLQLG